MKIIKVRTDITGHSMNADAVVGLSMVTTKGVIGPKTRDVMHSFKVVKAWFCIITVVINEVCVPFDYMQFRSSI